MVKRQLRVGEIVDDYCPRERRVSDHAIVAMVDDDIRQVRCTACDTEHEYRAAKVPPTRKKKPGAGPPPLPPAGMIVTPQGASQIPPLVVASPEASEAREVPSKETPEPVAADAAQTEDVAPVDGPVHRRLIRATLPRIEGQVPERRIPEFTMHNTGGRAPGGHGKSFRAGHGGPHRPGGGGGKPGSGHGRPGGGRPGGFSPQGGGRPGQQRNAFGGRPGRGKKT